MKKKILYYIVASFISVAVFAVTIELATRTVSWISGKGFALRLDELDPYDKPVTSIYRWHPFTGLIMKPRIIIDGSHPSSKETARIFVDRHGFIAKDDLLSLAKKEDEIRVAFIGASTTANINLPFDVNWPGRLGDLLQQAMPNKKVRVINAGIPGFDTAQSVGNLALRVMPFKPDIVIIYHAYNDLKAVSYDGRFEPDYSHIHTAPFGFQKKPPFYVLWMNRSMAYVRARNKYREIAEKERYLATFRTDKRLATVPDQAAHTFEEHMRIMVATAKAGGSKVVLSSFATLHDLGLDYTKNETISGLTRLKRTELGSLLHFTPGLTLEGIMSGLKRYNHILRNISANDKTGWVDNAQQVPHEDEYFVDRVHFSRAGAARMAENLLPVVLKEMKR